MARVGGINIPDNKHVDVSLTHVYGIGRKTAQDICDKLKIKYSKKVSELSEEQLDKIRDELKNFQIEGDLRRDIEKVCRLEGKEQKQMQEQEKVQGNLLKHNGWQKEDKKNSN